LSGWVEDGLRGAVQHGRPVLTEAQAVMSVADAAGWRVSTPFRCTAGKGTWVSEATASSASSARPGGVPAGTGYRAAERRAGTGIRSRWRARTTRPPNAVSARQASR
jgi:hypothetical protein